MDRVDGSAVVDRLHRDLGDQGNRDLGDRGHRDLGDQGHRDLGDQRQVLIVVGPIDVLADGVVDLLDVVAEEEEGKINVSAEGWEEVRCRIQDAKRIR